MASIKLTAEPTFKAVAKIIAAGGAELPIEFIYKHMRVTELAEFMHGKDSADRSDVDFVMAITAGWTNVDEDYSRESVETLLNNFGRAAITIGSTYLDEMTNFNPGLMSREELARSYGWRAKE